MENIKCIAVGEDNPNYFDIVLSDSVINHYRKIKEFLCNEWKNKDKTEIIVTNTGLYLYSSLIIFQIDRLYNQQKVLLNNVVNFLDNEKKDSDEGY